ncbi:MAG: hypothetical protein JW702_09130 [Clostridiales bacterium]|nr:hypothetical protein [Clostridiales bacterium]
MIIQEDFRQECAVKACQLGLSRLPYKIQKNLLIDFQRKLNNSIVPNIEGLFSNKEEDSLIARDTIRFLFSRLSADEKNLLIALLYEDFNITSLYNKGRYSGTLASFHYQIKKLKKGCRMILQQETECLGKVKEN